MCVFVCDAVSPQTTYPRAIYSSPLNFGSKMAGSCVIRNEIDLIAGERAFPRIVIQQIDRKLGE